MGSATPYSPPAAAAAQGLRRNFQNKKSPSPFIKNLVFVAWRMVLSVQISSNLLTETPTCPTKRHRGELGFLLLYSPVLCIYRHFLGRYRGLFKALPGSQIQKLVAIIANQSLAHKISL